MNSYKKTCLITNIGSHYRLPIFTKMWEEFGCDFYLGDKIDTPIKTFDLVKFNRTVVKEPNKICKDKMI